MDPRLASFECEFSLSEVVWHERVNGVTNRGLETPYLIVIMRMKLPHVWGRLGAQSGQLSGQSRG